MKKFFLVLVLLAFVFAGMKYLRHESSPFKGSTPDMVHHITMESQADDDSCSSAAVGAHTLITAAHCVIGDDRLKMDGKDAVILKAIYDHNDHALLIEDGVTFTNWSELESRAPADNEAVEFGGWPGHAKEAVHRFGFYTGTEQEPDKDVTLDKWVLPVFPGDSGSAMFDADGKIMAVVSLADRSANAYTFRLQFTPDQLAQIK